MDPTSLLISEVLNSLLTSLIVPEEAVGSGMPLSPFAGYGCVLVLAPRPGLGGGGGGSGSKLWLL